METLCVVTTKYRSALRSRATKGRRNDLSRKECVRKADFEDEFE